MADARLNVNSIAAVQECRHVLRAKLIAVALVGLALLLVTGCSSTGGSPDFASLTVRGHKPDEIRSTVVHVFSEAGFVDVSTRGSWMMDRRPSTMSMIMYGSWMEDSSVRERVKLRLIPVATDTWRVECEGVTVRYSGDSFFEEEAKLTRPRSGPYRKLLAEVQKQLL
jgi:hypothetical protein